jgi:hypothetical protein
MAQHSLTHGCDDGQYHVGMFLSIHQYTQTEVRKHVDSKGLMVLDQRANGNPKSKQNQKAPRIPTTGLIITIGLMRIATDNGWWWSSIWVDRDNQGSPCIHHLHDTEYESVGCRTQSKYNSKH